LENLHTPIPTAALKEELSKPGHFIRKTNKGNNEIYIVNNNTAPNVLLEIGRLRELTFRAAGGGTGLAYDIDHFDTAANCYQQLIVWSVEDEEIIGGYRFIECHKSIPPSTNTVELSTANYFKFSSLFLEKYLPYTIELGRSWVQPNFQPAVNPRKGLFALDNIWDGLGALIINNPHIKYFFGKVTMYTHYNAIARDMILTFLHKYFPDNENLLTPYNSLPILNNMENFTEMINQLDYKDAFKVLNQSVRNCNENIPPLVNIYMNLSPTMKTFGTAKNPHFGDVEETGILITINDIYPEKKQRHINSYKS
jgi:hypothetical protein